MKSTQPHQTQHTPTTPTLHTPTTRHDAPGVWRPGPQGWQTLAASTHRPSGFSHRSHPIHTHTHNIQLLFVHCCCYCSFSCSYLFLMCCRGMNLCILAERRAAAFWSNCLKYVLQQLEELWWQTNQGVTFSLWTTFSSLTSSRCYTLAHLKSTPQVSGHCFWRKFLVKSSRSYWDRAIAPVPTVL